MLRTEFAAKLETTIGYLFIRSVTYSDDLHQRCLTFLMPQATRNWSPWRGFYGRWEVFGVLHYITILEAASYTSEIISKNYNLLIVINCVVV